MYTFDKTNFQKHKMPGVEYLISIGYKKEDIGDNNHLGEPDIVTKDGKYWEIKNLEKGKRITFTYDQLLTFKDNVNIIIFSGKCSSSKKTNFIECITYSDIKKKCSGDNSIKFKREFEVFVNMIINFNEAFEIEKLNIKNRELYGHKQCFDYKNYEKDIYKRMNIPKDYQEFDIGEIIGRVFYKKENDKFNISMHGVNDEDKEKIMKKLDNIIKPKNITSTKQIFNLESEFFKKNG